MSNPVTHSSTPSPHSLQFDEEEFRQSLPYPVIATNLPGVYASAAWPEDFDLSTASNMALLRNGLPFHRPEKNADPAIIRAWNKAFSRKWLAKNRVVPRFSPRVVKPRKRGRPIRQSNGNYASPNWSGAALTGGNWGGVVGFWHVPTVSQPPEPAGPFYLPDGTLAQGWDSSSWVGIDGANFGDIADADVLQAGVQQAITVDGSVTYTAWYEWAVAGYSANPPGYPYVFQRNFMDFPVHAGDDIYCGVAYLSSEKGYIVFANETTGQHTSLTLKAPPGASFAGNTVEWIMEDPDGGLNEGVSLAKFSQVKFEFAVGCRAGTADDLGQLFAETRSPGSGNTIDMQTDEGNYLTNTTANDFTVTIDFTG
jgi:hypothetical protein